MRSNCGLTNAMIFEPILLYLLFYIIFRMSQGNIDDSENADDLMETEEEADDLDMLVDVTQKFANIATQKKNQISIMLLQQQQQQRDAIVRKI